VQVALGTGGIKPNVSAFGAEQFNDKHPADMREKQSFFNWFYFAINVGSLLASLVVVYIQENVSWVLGFGIPTAALLLAVISFWAGRHRYIPTLYPTVLLTRWFQTNGGSETTISRPTGD
jgi:dipeptide/tripeptide permease